MDIRLPLALAPAVAALSRHARDASNTATCMLGQIRMTHAFDKESPSSLRRTDEEMGEALAKSAGLCLAHFDGGLEKLQAEREASGTRGGGRGRSGHAWGEAPGPGSKPKRKKAAPPSKRKRTGT